MADREHPDLPVADRAGPGGHLAGRHLVLVADLATGAEVDGPEEQEPLRAPSIIKVAIAVAFLCQEPDPSEADEALLEAMIENSDNDAAATLYDRIGDEAGLQSVLDGLDMTDTTPASSWGFTTTTARDLAKLFTAVATGEALPESGTTLLVSMMQQVESDQTWGIADAVADGTPVAIKNGWYPDTDEPVWRVNCGAIVGDASTHRRASCSRSRPSTRSRWGWPTARRPAAGPPPPSCRARCGRPESGRRIGEVRRLVRRPPSHRFD